MANEIKEWNLKATFAGVAARQGVGSSGFVQPTTGAYRVKVTEAVKNVKDDGKESIRFQTVFIGGEFDGVEQRVYIGCDISKAGNLRSWKTALLSCGYSAAQIETGEIDLGSETFVGREAFVYYKAKDENDPTSQPDRQFITPESYASFHGEAVTVSNAAKADVKAAPKLGALGAATAAAPKPAASGALKAMLGR